MRILAQDGCSWYDSFTCFYASSDLKSCFRVVTLSCYIHLISKFCPNEVYGPVPISNILDLEVDDHSLHILSATELKTTKIGEDDLSPVV